MFRHGRVGDAMAGVRELLTLNAPTTTEEEFERLTLVENYAEYGVEGKFWTELRVMAQEAGPFLILLD